MEYILVFLSALFLAFDFVVDKIYQVKSGNSLYSGFRYNLYIGIFGTILFLCINRFSFEFTPFSMIISLICALIVALYKIIGLKIIENGSVAIYTIFLLSGGMIVPYIWGIFFLNESITFFKIIGLITISFAVVVAYKTKEKINKKQLFLCILVFFINGMSSVVSKYHQIQTEFAVVDTLGFVILQNIARVLISLLIILFIKDNKTVTYKKSAVFLLFALSAIFGGLAGFLNVFSAKTVPATILYPLITGGAIVFTAIAARLAFKEKITKNLFSGILLCIAGVMLFSI